MSAPEADWNIEKKLGDIWDVLLARLAAETPRFALQITLLASLYRLSGLRTEYGSATENYCGGKTCIRQGDGPRACMAE
jgi:hypothetical protein